MLGCQPLEDTSVVVSKPESFVKFLADFIRVALMNPRNRITTTYPYLPRKTCPKSVLIYPVTIESN